MLYDWDHPRSRGYYVSDKKSSFICLGSPPLTRVLPHDFLLPFLLNGITPAHAGITHEGTLRCISCRDHPRSRGYYKINLKKFASILGSPPLTRVLLIVGGEEARGWRITPAHAGITLKNPSKLHLPYTKMP